MKSNLLLLGIFIFMSSFITKGGDPIAPSCQNQLTVASVVNFSPLTFDCDDTVIYLDELYDYANQAVPNFINRDLTPINNPISNAGATLGRVLFYDKNLSRNNTIACGTCHKQEFAFGDPAVASTGVNGTTGRHSMRLTYARFGSEDNFFWDERANNLEDQTTQPIKDHVEMGFSGQNGDPGFNDLIEKLEAIDYYQTLFTQVFGDPAITEERMQLVIAQFIRSIQSFDSRYDIARAQTNNNGGPFPGFTMQENMGKDLFSQGPQFAQNGQRVGGGLGCDACHRAPDFGIDDNINNNGVVASIGGGQDFTNTRSPSLRDIFNQNGEVNVPFMHNGEFDTIEEVLNHYNVMPNVPNLDNRLRPGGNPQRLNMTTQEREAVVAFLKTLTSVSVYTDPRWSDPFSEEGELLVLETNAPEILLETDGISILQNPTESDLHIVLNSGNYSVRILNQDGSLHQNLNVNNSMIYDLCQLPFGIFLLEIVDLANPENVVQQMIQAE